MPVRPALGTSPADLAVMAGGVPVPVLKWDSHDSPIDETGSPGEARTWGEPGLELEQSNISQRPNIITNELNGRQILRFAAANNQNMALINSANVRDLIPSDNADYWDFSVRKVRARITDAGLWTAIRFGVTGSNNDFDNPSGYYIGNSFTTFGGVNDNDSFRAGFPTVGQTTMLNSGDLSGGWYITAYHWTPTTASLYVNGLLIATSAVGTATAFAPDSFVIGGRLLAGVAAAVFSDLDQAAKEIYLGPLSSTQINYIWANLRNTWLPGSPIVWLP